MQSHSSSQRKEKPSYRLSNCRIAPKPDSRYPLRNYTPSTSSFATPAHVLATRATNFSTSEHTSVQTTRPYRAIRSDLRSIHLCFSSVNWRTDNTHRSHAAYNHCSPAPNHQNAIRTRLVTTAQKLQRHYARRESKSGKSSEDSIVAYVNQSRYNQKYSTWETPYRVSLLRCSERKKSGSSFSAWTMVRHLHIHTACSFDIQFCICKFKSRRGTADLSA